MCCGLGLPIVRVQTHKNVKKREMEAYPRKEDCVITFEENLGAPTVDDAPTCGKEVSIYKVPDHRRKSFQDNVCTPRVVSIGPYHHDKVRKMQEQKSQVLKNVLKRTRQAEKLFTDSMKEIEDRTRACYEEHSDLSSDSFVEMMKLDGCLILEILQGINVVDGFVKLGYATDHPIFSKKGTLCSIRQDMLMLENQIPLFVLDKLLGLQNLGRKSNVVLDTLLGLQGAGKHTSIAPSRPRDSLSDQLGLHYLDVYRKTLLQEGPEPVIVEDEQREHLKYCATELRNAGIKFKQGSKDKFWNIKFKNGALYIPLIEIDDGFKLIFFNLIAFEQRHLGFDHHITSYLAFLSDLIKSDEDVRFLKNQGVIEHMVGSDAEVAEVIKGLLHQVYCDRKDSYLSHLSWQINEYCKQKCHTWWASPMKRYFKNPLAVICSAFGAISFFMTAAQASYAIISYHWPKK